MDRGVSTVLDVGVACLLITAAATLLVGGPPTPSTPADADRVGRALLVSTVTVPADDRRTAGAADGGPPRGDGGTVADGDGGDPLVVATSAGDLLANAAETGDVRPKIRHTIANLSRRIHRRTVLHAGLADGPGVSGTARVIRIGSRPPPGATVDAAVFRIGPSASTPVGDADTGRVVVIVVRTWSP